MSIRTSTAIIVLLGGIICAIVISLVMHGIIDDSFESLEHTYSKRDMDRVRSAIEYEYRKLDELIVDWAVWDDSKLFMEGKSPEFVASNLNDRTLAALRLSAILFFDTQGRPAWAQGINPVEGTKAPLPEGLLDRLQEGSLLSISTMEQRTSGLMLLPQGIAIVAACPILSSEGAGPSVGVLVMVRAIDDLTTTSIAERVRLPLTLTREDSPLSADLAPLHLAGMQPGDAITGPIDDSQIAGVLVMPDIAGKAAMRAEVREPRDIVQQGNIAVRRLLLWMSAGVLVVTAMLFLMLERRLLSRLSKLTHQVQGIDGSVNELGRLHLPGSDELVALATHINDLLSEIERSRFLYLRQIEETGEQKDYLQVILDSIHAGVVLADPETHEILEANDFAATCIGLPRDAILHQPCQEVFCPCPKGQCPVTDLARGIEQAICHLKRHDGSCMAILKSVTHVHRHGKALLLETFIDVDDLYKTQEALRKAEEVYRTVFMNTGTATFRFEENGLISLVNQEFEKLLGYGRDEIEGIKLYSAFSAPEDKAVLERYHMQRLREPSLAPRNYETRIINKKGETRIVRVTIAFLPESKATVASFEDVTDIKEAESLLQHQALHDALTGLPNRFLLHDRISQAIEISRREKTGAAILLMDLDQFKNINDSLGHETGDRLLKRVASRLTEGLRGSDTVARLGGDEFVILARDASSMEHTCVVAQKALGLLSKPFDLDGYSLHVNASIGIAMVPDHGDSPGVLLRNADMAMYQAKGRGRNTYAFFSNELKIQTVTRLRVEHSLRRALASGGIEVHYQPKVSLPGYRICGFEALARLRTEDGALVPPADFIPVAEVTGLISPLTEIVLNTAGRQAALWGKALGRTLSMAVNISPAQFLQADVAERLIDMAQATGLPLDALELEITEDTLLTNKTETIRAMRHLNNVGVKIVLDDFGKGYSSLTYIKKLPISGIKIDRAFISGLPHDAENAAIIRAIFSMADNLSLSVVAEGVETLDQLLFLKNIGCLEFQGYYFSKPLPVAEMSTLLAAWKQEHEDLANPMLDSAS